MATRNSKKKKLQHASIPTENDSKIDFTRALHKNKILYIARDLFHMHPALMWHTLHGFRNAQWKKYIRQCNSSEIFLYGCATYEHVRGVLWTITVVELTKVQTCYLLVKVTKGPHSGGKLGGNCRFWICVRNYCCFRLFDRGILLVFVKIEKKFWCY